MRFVYACKIIDESVKDTERLTEIDFEFVLISQHPFCFACKEKVKVRKTTEQILLSKENTGTSTIVFFC